MTHVYLVIREGIGNFEADFMGAYANEQNAHDCIDSLRSLRANARYLFHVERVKFYEDFA